MASKGMDGSCFGRDLAGVRDSARDHKFVSCPKQNSLVIDNQRVAALDNDHILVVIVHMLR
jgi:hypothetical protein